MGVASRQVGNASPNFPAHTPMREMHAMAIAISYTFGHSWERHSLDMLDLELREILSTPPTP